MAKAPDAKAPMAVAPTAAAGTRLAAAGCKLVFATRARFVARKFLPLIATSQLCDFVSPRDQHNAYHVDEQSVLNHARQVVDRVRQRSRIIDWPKITIEDVVPFVRDIRPAAGLAKLHGGSQRFCSVRVAAQMR
jgi:hypothetical protein